MKREPLRVLYLGLDSPESARLAEVLDGARDALFEFHWELRLEDALARLAEEEFDALLLALPRHDVTVGEALAGVRELRPRLSVVACTRELDREAGREALEQGAVDHIILEHLDPEVAVRSLRLAGATTHLAETRERLDAVVAGTPTPLWDWDVRTDRIRFSAPWWKLLGLQADGSEGTADDWFRRVHPDDLDGLLSDVAEHIAGQSEALEAVYRVRHCDGSYRRVTCHAVARRDATGAILLAGSQQEVREVEVAGEAPQQAFRDPITGLPSRELFMERLGRSIARVAVHRRELYAVLVLDLDRFQAVNDGLGHAAGDRLLAEVTERLAHCLADNDTLTRLGSDKFAMLLDEIDRPSDALRIAERACSLFEHPFVLDGEEVFVTAGIGIALAAPAYAKPEDAMRDAYSAMHRAKEKGGSSYAVFDPEVQARSVARLRLETDLRRALERDELVLHYQPIVSMASGAITGFEALLRWQNPERGLVPPGAFIRVAEETGLIVPIGRWVLGEACRTIAGWRERYDTGRPLSVSVNLSGRQFAESGLAGDVEEAMGSLDLAPDALKLEITESVLMETSADNEAQLRRLRELGVELALDDFGTGYSSLSALHRFPIETLKIDRSFVGRMDFEDENSEIVKTIVNLGRNLDMDIVAEGVETKAQLEELRGLGCQMGQGFLFSNAVDAEAATSWLESAPRW